MKKERGYASKSRSLRAWLSGNHHDKVERRCEQWLVKSWFLSFPFGAFWSLLVPLVVESEREAGGERREE